MSDLAPHKLCSCQLGQCSPYVCEHNPRRSLIAAVRDVSAVRDLPVWTFELIRQKPTNVVSLAKWRALHP